MHSARPAMFDRSMAGRPARVPPINRTSVCFHVEAEQRRRSAAAAKGAGSPDAITASAWDRLNDLSYAEICRRAHARRAAYFRAVCGRMVAFLKALPQGLVAPGPSSIAPGIPAPRPVWQRPRLFGCVALAALVLAIAGPAFDAARTRPCRTEPAAIASVADLGVTKTVSHGAACAIWTKAENVTINDVKIAVAPHDGNLALRGRTGVTYRPDREFTGDDFFALTLRGRSGARDELSVVRVSVTVK